MMVDTLCAIKKAMENVSVENDECNEHNWSQCCETGYDCQRYAAIKIVPKRPKLPVFGYVNNTSNILLVILFASPLFDKSLSFNSF